MHISAHLGIAFINAATLAEQDDPRGHRFDDWYWHQRQVSGLYSWGRFPYWEVRRRALLYALYAPPRRLQPCGRSSI
jgi:hypothetical protein